MSNTKHHIIDKFGTANLVAQICGVTPGAVSQWELIPAKHQATLLREAHNYRVDLSPNDFHFLPTQPPTKKPPSTKN